MRLWHKEFWLMATANLLLSMSVTMLIPVLPIWLRGATGMDATHIGMVMAAFALGLFLPGAFCSYLVQQYRRNMVFMMSVLVLAASMVLPFLPQSVYQNLTVVIVWRVLQGAAFGLAQMVLTSTLIIDTCESHQRTEANHSATWFGRFALSLGPMSGLLLLKLSDVVYPERLIESCSGDLSPLNVFFIAAVCCLVAVVLVLFIHFPFRIPEDGTRLMSLDRFFLPSGFPLFLNLMLVTVAIGLLMSMAVPANSYGMVMIGFLLALLAQRFVFRNAEVKSEVISGLLLMAAAIIILLASLM